MTGERASRPDYATARSAAGFEWAVGGSVYVLLELTGISLKEFFLEPEAGIRAYREGLPRMRELLGPDVAMPAPATPAISYGHVNTLGARLIFPENSEVGHTHIYGSLREGLAALRRPIDFAAAGMMPFYLDYHRKMSAAFPDRPVGFGFAKVEGPLTTAWELRGEGFFTDIFDSPGEAGEFLGLVVENSLEFHRFAAGLFGRPAVDPAGGGMTDDIAAMIPHRLWPDFVLPWWERYYRGITSGTRSAHVEDLVPPQLPFLEEVGLSYFDPSISERLNPRLIAGGCRVPFGWRLGCQYYRDLEPGDMADFVFQAAADGASRVFTHVTGLLLAPSELEKVRAFIEAGKEAKKMFDRGAPRSEAARLVSPAGRRKFWQEWVGARGRPAPGA